MTLNLSKLTIIVSIFCAFTWISCSPEKDEPTPQNQNPPETPDDEDEDDEQDDTRTYSTTQYTVGDINIEIHLPSDYVEGNKYPTLYFNDGDFFAEIFGSLTSLEAEPFIMVGIWDDHHRAARFSTYEDEELTNTYGAYTPNAEAYTKALVEEVIPFVEARYTSSKRALFGISLGGLHATWAGIKYPGVFSFIGALSPSYWVGDGALFNESLEALRPVGLAVPKIFYFDRGTSEWRNFMPLVESLKQVELVYAKNIYYYEVIGADHNSQSWLFRIEVPFRLFLEGPEELVDMEVSAYCVENLDMPGTKQARINPIVTYSNGAKFSVMTEAAFQVIAGDGLVQADGTYTINSGSILTVDCRYMGFTKRIQLSQCN